MNVPVYISSNTLQPYSMPSKIAAERNGTGSRSNDSYDSTHNRSLSSEDVLRSRSGDDALFTSEVAAAWTPAGRAGVGTAAGAGTGRSLSPRFDPESRRSIGGGGGGGLYVGSRPSSRCEDLLNDLPPADSCWNDNNMNIINNNNYNTNNSREQLQQPQYRMPQQHRRPSLARDNSTGSIEGGGAGNRSRTGSNEIGLQSVYGQPIVAMTAAASQERHSAFRSQSSLLHSGP